MEIRGRTALLTGATGGLGRAIAAELAARGAKLILSGRDQGDLEALGAELPGDGHRSVAADLIEPGAVSKLMSDAGEHDVLIANAGVSGGDALLTGDHETIARVIRLNLEVPAQMAASSIVEMIPRGSGHLVFISSLAGKAIPSNAALYSSSKAGLRSLGLGLANDLDGTGIGVSTIYPGFVREAGMFHDSGAKPPPGFGTATPEEVGEAVAEAIVDGKREMDVAPLQQRSFANFAFHFHRVSSKLERAAGGREVGEQIARGAKE